MSAFLYHSRFWGFYKCKICHFSTFRDLNIYTFQGLESTKSTKFKAPKMAKMSIVELKDCPKIDFSSDRKILKCPHHVQCSKSRQFQFNNRQILIRSQIFWKISCTYSRFILLRLTLICWFLTNSWHFS